MNVAVERIGTVPEVDGGRKEEWILTAGMMTDGSLQSSSLNFVGRSTAGGFFAVRDSDKGCKELEDVLVEQLKTPVGLRPSTTMAASCFVVAREMKLV
jgi:hypothetical protein